MSNHGKTTKQVKIISRTMNYPFGRIICIDNKSADELVADGDAEYCHEYDRPKVVEPEVEPEVEPKEEEKPKRGPGRPKTVVKVAALEPPQTPEDGILKQFSGKPGKKKGK